ncbi:hypothetical protein IFR05_015376 [Cadophora sp. M221]|nr:hypothetical protein IFR05_015376 [Cadophora sp. M221]
MAKFDSESALSKAQKLTSASTSTSTPPLRPFQQPLTSQTRLAHEAYLERRIDDHIDSLQPLTPSYSRSPQAYHTYTNRKMAEVQLIENREVERIEHAKQKSALRAGSSRYVQKSGAIRFGDARAQIQERKTQEWLQESERDVVNIAERRQARAKALEDEKAARTIAKEQLRVQKLAIHTVDREEQQHRKDTTKEVVQELSKAITRAGLRARVSLFGKEVWKPLEWHVKHKGEIWEVEGPVHEVIDIYVKWRIEYTKMLLYLQSRDVNLEVLRSERGRRRIKAFNTMRERGVFAEARQLGDELIRPP